MSEQSPPEPAVVFALHLTADGVVTTNESPDTKETPA